MDEAKPEIHTPFSQIVSDIKEDDPQTVTRVIDAIKDGTADGEIDLLVTLAKGGDANSNKFKEIEIQAQNRLGTLLESGNLDDRHDVLIDLAFDKSHSEQGVFVKSVMRLVKLIEDGKFVRDELAVILEKSRGTNWVTLERAAEIALKQ